MTSKRNTLLYIAIGLPLLMILIIVIDVLFFSMNKYPKDNFLYAITTTNNAMNFYYCKDEIKKQFRTDYTVMHPKDATLKDCKSYHLYVYDVKTLKRSPIAMKDALQLSKTHILKDQSEDGFTLSESCDTSYPIWGIGSDYYLRNLCLMNKDYRKRINPKTILSGEDNMERFVFIGWITNIVKQ